MKPNPKTTFFAMVGMLLFCLCSNSHGQKKAADTDKKIDELLSKMSIEEKVGQMTQVTIDLILKNNSTTEIDSDKLNHALLEKHVGSILNVKEHAYTIETWHKIQKAIQDVATKKTEHKIPLVYGIDAIHGANYIQGAVLYPHNIGMAATRNPELVKESAHLTAIETRASGIRWNFDPVLGLGRQPLWSRFEETFGEDVYLVSEMGSAAIKAYQGDDLTAYSSVAACLKHFLGYSLPASGKDRTPAYITDYTINEYLLPPFQAAVDANAATAMINSAEINGVPVHGSKYYLTEVLRNQLGFKGVAVSDWEDVIRLHTRHHIAATPKEAVRIAVEAGLDMSMVPLDYSFYDLLVELVKEGTISESRIDVSVKRILKLKYDLGLFDNAYPEKQALKLVDREKEEEVAKTAALESMTLLKNENNVLPLPKNAKVLLAGPAANDVTSLHSSWSYVWQGSDASKYPNSTKTIKQALEAKLGAGNVTCQSTSDYAAEANYDVDQFKNKAAGYDYIVLCLGEKAYAESPGSINDLTLPQEQIDLAKAAIATGKKVILVLVEGRPRIVSSFVDEIPGVLMAYRPSTKGADAIADVLVGDYNPNGILPYSYPRYTGDLIKYDFKYSEAIKEDVPNEYTLGEFSGQWPFGHGLSYTTFEVTDLKSDKTIFSQSDELNITAKVKNTGKREGKVTIELYSSDLYASITPNNKRLKRFEKISLKPGEEKTVSFKIAPKDLAFVNAEGKKVTEPGDFVFTVKDKKVKVTYK
ncbi:glycoside hydrolase family 3 C-terminal domain-containing protein [Fulvivirga maritima]|uniref:glycoside hydrolase family 3 N-terminal domain-containing protein n=1 Tax=Fulvivirga maritima TaxID=2904247 RepID=UPI001F1C4E47|nr:glycoside hydrolase family 3 N-terminal domain-containing protein [Fulvivirga maritima]UII28104.1 glycoside hydrolase family 3 C-terminal domain-containing protein [Fulvivirga maritima]